MSRLLLYHDFASPFCRLATRIAADAARRAGLELRPVPFELHPAPVPLPTPGGPLAAELQAAEEAAREWGLELGRLVRVPRTRKAHEAVAFAREHGAGEAMLLGVYEALWAGGRDISRLDVLAAVAEDVGLDGEAAHVALGTDAFAEEVVREQEAALAAGLAGVPAFQLRDNVAVGLTPFDELLEWIEASR